MYFNRLYYKEKTRPLKDFEKWSLGSTVNRCSLCRAALKIRVVNPLSSLLLKIHKISIYNLENCRLTQCMKITKDSFIYCAQSKLRLLCSKFEP